jgi:hypothetical protein
MQKIGFALCMVETDGFQTKLLMAELEKFLLDSGRFINKNLICGAVFYGECGR